MRKFFKNMMLTAMSVGLLAGCGSNKTHLVTFYLGLQDAIYKDDEVAHGKTVARPENPTKEGFTFDDWYLKDENGKYGEKYNFDTKVNDDLDLFAKWDRIYVPSESEYHIVGDLANTDLDYINWATKFEGDPQGPIDERSYLTKAETSNTFSIELEIGYNGMFKIKKPGVPWDDDTEADYTTLYEVKEGLDVPEYLKEGDTRNVLIKDAAKYRIEFEEDELWLKVTRIGDVAEGSGAKPNPEEGSVPNYGIAGTVNSWGDEEDLALTYNEMGEYYHYDLIYLEKDAEFKLRADNSWSVQHGPSENDVLDENITYDLDEEEKPTGNYKVGKTGIYQLVFVPSEEGDVLYARLATFGYRGSAAPLNWNDDAEPLTVDAEDPLRFTGSITFTSEGETKLKLGALGPYDGWQTSFSTVEGKNMAVVAGTYEAELVFKTEGALVELETFTFTKAA